MEEQKDTPKRGRPKKGEEAKSTTIQASFSKELHDLFLKQLSATGLPASMFMRALFVQYLLDIGVLSGWEEVESKFKNTPKLPGK